MPIELSIVVPTYKERDNLALLTERIFAVVSHETSELLIVDDNSPDGTAAEAERLAARYPVRVVVRTSERGLATAVIEGIRQARGAIIVVMDADLSHPPERIPALVAALADDAVDAAVGSRFVPGGKVDLHWPLHRRLISRIGRFLARPLTSVADMASGFFAFRRARVRLNDLRPVGYKILLEFIVRGRWRSVVEVPITFTDRAHGQTKLNMAEQWRYVRHLARLYAHALTRPRSADRTGETP